MQNGTQIGADYFAEFRCGSAGCGSVLATKISVEICVICVLFLWDMSTKERKSYGRK
jgi:hypothetical protein